nr:hypothetical protein CFP56_22218 [Quercus suber]
MSGEVHARKDESGCVVTYLLYGWTFGCGSDKGGAAVLGNAARWPPTSGEIVARRVALAVHVWHRSSLAVARGSVYEDCRRVLAEAISGKGKVQYALPDAGALLVRPDVADACQAHFWLDLMWRMRARYCTVGVVFSENGLLPDPGKRHITWAPLYAELATQIVSLYEDLDDQRTRPTST